MKKEEEEGLEKENNVYNSPPDGQDSSSPLLPRKLVGFICSTRSLSDELHHESMNYHDSKGTTLCIHSVVVEEKVQRRGMDVYTQAFRRHAVGIV